MRLLTSESSSISRCIHGNLRWLYPGQDQPAMPPHLHPRSRATSALFTGTLLASFVVVGLPHIFPCPVPRKGFADSGVVMVDGQPRARRKRRKDENSTQGSDSRDTIDVRGENAIEEQRAISSFAEEERAMQELTRECPVPKPGGFIGELLGFTGSKKGNSESQSAKDITNYREGSR